MKSLRILTASAIIALSGFVGPAAAEHHNEKKAEDIVFAASNAGSFDTMVAALKAAGLVETLQGNGPFTVFAPTDAAFSKLPEGTIESLLKPENKDTLVSILTYHVLSGKVMAVDVKSMDVKTVNGTDLSVKVTEGKVTVEGANVVKADVTASNGVIHFIDTVVLPK